MSVGFSIQVQDGATPALQRLSSSLTNRKGLNRSMATRAEVLTRKHLISLAGSRHATATRLGAAPTGHLARAAENVTSESNAVEASVSVTSPGIGRVAHDLDIRPVNGAWLTIPIHALAYGRTAREVEALLGRKLFRPGAKNDKKRVLSATVGKGKAASLVNFFALSKGVVQKQDRTLLPSDEEYLAEALLGAQDYVRLLIQAQKGNT